ncbi:glucuronoxylan 4-O-methyltransferase 2-like [Abrus precatorius]|uniref:Glucuronoxylan 4-O-methyltransferase 2-like n=1 Tax=Abrus precatorius TaxID=3816 RepID=A0A8B8K1Y3_ABRPR|nr:glucuronoxylan 4-O-methyltransferase 2-like [Abrus precatorius]
MPPDILHFRPLLSPLVQFSPPLITRAQENQPSIHNYWQGTKGMNLTKKKLIPILVLILSVISLLRLLSLSVKTSPSTPGIFALSPAPQQSCSPPLSTQNKVASQAPGSSEQPRRPPNNNNNNTLTEKEFEVLSDLIALKSPCNLLIFGFQPQYLILSSMNAAGNTIFLEDDPDKVSKVRINSNSTQIYKLEYNMPAKAAYKLLKHARQNPECAPNHRFLQKSKCKLALKNLPSQVYEKNWDVMVVDGPSGDSPESPGRMATIYTASVLARAGNASDVVVHDVDRMIEKWFSWEFLCDENLLYSKGKLWHFRMRGPSNSTGFCPAGIARPCQNEEDSREHIHSSQALLSSPSLAQSYIFFLKLLSPVLDSNLQTSPDVFEEEMRFPEKMHLNSSFASNHGGGALK